jgi:hypothetical protein
MILRCGSKYRGLLPTIGALFAFGCAADAGAGQAAGDVIVYKASPAGIMAAVAAARLGAKVIVVEPTGYVGGIIGQGGLGASDVGNYSTIGGLSREFFRRTGDYYRTTYGPDSPQLKDSRIGTLDGGQVEPKVAAAVLEGFLKEQPRIRVMRNLLLASVEKTGSEIISIACRPPEGGAPMIISGKEFIDASYTGDLMAMAGVSSMLGSEGRAQFGESLARDSPGPQIQAYNYRVTLTNNPANRAPIQKPPGYTPSLYDGMSGLWSRQTFPTPQCWFQYHLPNQKIDANFADLPGTNWTYPEESPAERARLEARQRDFALGFYYFLQNDPRLPEANRTANSKWGLSKDEYPDNSHFPREIYVREARRMKAGYVMRQQDIQEDRLKPDSIAIGSLTLDCHATQRPDPGLSRRAPWMRPDGGVMAPVRPYDIPYRSLVPMRQECGNLLVPVCLGATHVAWMSIRMEPVLMMTGEAAGMAATLSLDHGAPVQDVPLAELQEELKKDGAILHAYVAPVAGFEWQPANPRPGEPVHFFARPVIGTNPVESYYWNFDGSARIDSREQDPTITFNSGKGSLVTFVVSDTQGHHSNPVFKVVPVGSKAGDIQVDSDDDNARGGTEKSASTSPYYGTGFGLDMGFDKGRVSQTYTAGAALAGTYSIYISSSPGANRSKNALVVVLHGGRTDRVRVDESRGDPIFGWNYVGDFSFDAVHPASVTISNAGTNGVVIYDAVRWVLKSARTPASNQ